MGSPEILAYHRSLFQWHCRHFFNFRRHLNPTEKAYLETCFRLATDFDEISEAGYEHFSYYTYSHRIKGSKTNSSRLAYGSVQRPEETVPAALEVLNKRGIKLENSLLQQHKFYGLGWDLEEEQFKIYLRTLDWTTLPAELHQLVCDFSTDEYRREALLSLTYQGQETIERKVYLYPKQNLEKPGVRGSARMITDRRGIVTQEDVSSSEQLPYQLNQEGVRIVELYRGIGEDLDTIAYHGPEDFTLYFP